jgi:hypothetical protein
MLTPRTVFDIHKITDAESSRYALGGVRFERDETGRPLAIATDGRRLMVLGWREDDADKYPLTAADSSARLPAGSGLLIPAKDCREAAQFKVGAGLLKSKKFLGCSIIDESAADGQPVKIAASNIEKSVCDTVKQIEGRYPKWRDIITPAVGEAVHSIEVNAQYLIDLVEVAAKHCRRSDGESHIVLSLDAAAPSHCGLTITAANTDGATAYGILMPVNNGTDEPHAGAAWLPVEFSKERIKAAANKARQAIAARFAEANGNAGNTMAADEWQRKSLELTEELNALKAENAKRDREAARSAQKAGEAVTGAVAEIARLQAELNAAKAAADAADNKLGRADAKADKLAGEVDKLRAELTAAYEERNAARADKLAAEQAAKLATKAAAKAAAASPAPLQLAKPAALSIVEEREPGRRFSHLAPPVSVPLAASVAIVAPAKITEPPRAIAARTNGAAPSRPAWQAETDEDRRRILWAVHC